MLSEFTITAMIAALAFVLAILVGLPPHVALWAGIGAVGWPHRRRIAQALRVAP